MLFLIGAYSVALSVRDLGIVLAVVGATGSTLVSWVLPGYFFYAMHSDSDCKWKRRAALTQAMVGLMFIPVSLVFIFT